MAIHNEAFDYLWNKLANGSDIYQTRRLKDSQKKRLRRVELGLSLKPYFLQATWTNPAGTAGEEAVAVTEATTSHLLVLDGTTRTTGSSIDVDDSLASTGSGFFDFILSRSGGDSRVQVSREFVRNSHLVGPQQCGLQSVATAFGCGQPWPLSFPVPLYLMPNELLQIRSKVLPGGLRVALSRTFVQFRSVAIDSRTQRNDQLLADVRESINRRELQEAVYLSMFSEGKHSITVPDTSAQKTTAKTRETDEHLLVLGYAALFARSQSNNKGSSMRPRWKLQSSNGYSFSRSEVDVNCYPYAGPGLFYQQFPQPFFLPKGSSLSATFSALTDATNALDTNQNYVFFRCVTV